MLCVTMEGRVGGPCVVQIHARITREYNAHYSLRTGITLLMRQQAWPQGRESSPSAEGMRKAIQTKIW